MLKGIILGFTGCLSLFLFAVYALGAPDGSIEANNIILRTILILTSFNFLVFFLPIQDPPSVRRSHVVPLDPRVKQKTRYSFFPLWVGKNATGKLDIIEANFRRTEKQGSN